MEYPFTSYRFGGDLKIICVGDTNYQQMAGGSIGLELTGAVARPFMLRYDELYMTRVREAGLNLMFYERYVDDSNQVAIVPPPGTKYDANTKRTFIDENSIDIHENSEERTARVLLEIANTIVPGIEMEYDIPDKNVDKKMPILDMKVWINKETGNIMFQHYEKPTASKNILYANSAQPITCRNSVHTQEILRRILNCSPELDWSKEIAPILTEYMRRMMKSGYKQKYRIDTLTTALRIFDKMKKEEIDGTRPLYRPKEWNIVARRKEKERKKYEWSTKGGHVAPIFVPPHP